jgi:hypothetical protein
MAKKSKNYSKLSLSSVCFFIFLAFVAILYFHNLTIDVYGGDVGDLVAAAYTLGVAHPPGYPLFTFLGFLLSHVPLNMLTVSKIALISVISAILSLYFLWNILRLTVVSRLVSLLSVSILSFSYLFWLYSELPEVFILNVLLCLVFLFFTVLFYKTNKFKHLLLASFFLGLGLTNHQTIVLLVPQFLMFLILRRNEIFKFKTKLLLVPLAFLLGLIPYIYIPIAASNNPPINWDNASNLQNFIRLVLRRDYGTFSAGAFPQPVLDAKIVILKNFVMTFISSITFPAVLIGLTGILYSLKKDKVISLGLLLSFILTGPVFTLYAGFPVVNSFILGAAERFFILPIALFVIFTAYGLVALKVFCERIFSKKIYAIALILVFFLIPVLLFQANYKKTDLSQTTLGTQFGKDYLRNLPKGAILIVSGDTKSFNIWYTRYVLRFRTDIELVTIGNFGFESKYFKNAVNQTQKESRLKGMDLYQKTLENITLKRPVYSTDPISLTSKDFVWLPSGLSVRLIKNSEFPTENEYRKIIRQDFKDIKIPNRDDLTLVQRSLTLSGIPSFYADAFYRIGNTFLDNYNDIYTASLYFKDSLVIDPQYSKGYIGQSRIENARHECREAEKDIKKALSYSPTENTYYLLLYVTVLGCSNDKKEAQSIANLYKQYFHIDISNDLKKMQ